MTAFSDYLENAILNHILGNGAYTTPSTLYLALFTSDPTDAGSGTEVSAGGYARQTITFGSASGGVAASNNAPSFTASGAGYGTITHIGIYDHVSAGNLLFHGTCTNRTIADTETLLFPAGSITITVD